MLRASAGTKEVIVADASAAPAHEEEVEAPYVLASDHPTVAASSLL